MFTQSSSLGLQIAFLIGIAPPLSSVRLSNPRTRLSKHLFEFKASHPFVFQSHPPHPSGLPRTPPAARRTLGLFRGGVALNSFALRAGAGGGWAWTPAPPRPARIGTPWPPRVPSKLGREPLVRLRGSGDRET